MDVRYDSDTDVLTIVWKKASDPFEYERDGVLVVVDDETDELVEITIPSGQQIADRVRAVGHEDETVEEDAEASASQRGMVWHDADSSMISAFGYDEAEDILEVAFHRSGVYRYFDVPKQVFDGLREASSKGRYMRAHVIDLYPYEQKR